jgi:hypothetical protein
MLVNIQELMVHLIIVFESVRFFLDLVLSNDMFTLMSAFP